MKVQCPLLIRFNRQISDSLLWLLDNLSATKKTWGSRPSPVNSRLPLLLCQYAYRKSCIRSGNSEFISEEHHKEDELQLSEGSTLNMVDVLKVLKDANSFIPHVVAASTLLALLFPPSFTWFTNRYYAPALGFLMFSVGINSSAKDFILAIKRPDVIALGYIGQYMIKPLLGLAFGSIAVALLGLPDAIGSGIILTSCVSGAQLSNYATYLTDPAMAPLSIVMTALSTASAVVVTPMLTLFLLGKRLPVDVQGMMSSIMQIVIAPVVAGLLLNKFAPQFCSFVRQLLPPLSVLVTALCVGSPLAVNINTIRSTFGLAILVPIVGFHALAFVVGYVMPGFAFSKAPDMKGLQRTISFETGMQSSLLGLALANKFFQDPLVGVPSAISVVVMSLMGFSLVMLWKERGS